MNIIDDVPSGFIKEYLTEFMAGNDDGFDDLQIKVIHELVQDIILYANNRGEVLTCSREDIMDFVQVGHVVDVNGAVWRVVK